MTGHIDWKKVPVKFVGQPNPQGLEEFESIWRSDEIREGLRNGTADGAAVLAVAAGGADLAGEVIHATAA